MRHTISALVENQFGVLARVAGMFSGRGFNIDSLNVGPTEDDKLSRITVTVIADDDSLDQCVKQLKKLVNVLTVEHFSSRDAFVARELIMLKVKADSHSRAEIMQICDVFRAKIVDVSPRSLNIEVTGNENKTTAFLDMIAPFGILQLARTGNVALSRGDIDETV